jgi:hypothetical protein
MVLVVVGRSGLLVTQEVLVDLVSSGARMALVVVRVVVAAFLATAALLVCTEGVEAVVLGL